MPRSVDTEDVLIGTLLNIHESYQMDEYDLKFEPEQVRLIRRTVRHTQTYLWHLQPEERQQLIAEIAPGKFYKLSCVLNKGLAESFKIIYPTISQKSNI